MEQTAQPPSDQATATHEASRGESLVSPGYMEKEYSHELYTGQKLESFGFLAIGFGLLLVFIGIGAVLKGKAMQRKALENFGAMQTEVKKNG